MMRRERKRVFRYVTHALTLLMAVVMVVLCMGELRPLLSWHEQQHLFRWTSVYLHEQWSTWGGWWEWVVSFFTQFFYVGWLGAVVVAFLAVVLQLLVWWLMRLCHLRNRWFYPLSFIPSVLLFTFVLIPKSYREDATFREAVDYDYLVRTHQWDAILRKTRQRVPLSDNAIWCTNYALAMRGELCDSLFRYPQSSPDGLLYDARRVELLSLFSLSDIFFQIGFINDAERMAFDAKQLLPDSHKSGRLYRRLAECNLVNGDTATASKYIQILSSALFYRSWAQRYRPCLTSRQLLDADPYYGERRRFRVRTDSLITPSLPHKLQSLLIDCPTNHLASEYLLAYQLLRLDFQGVLDAELREQQRQQRVAPWAVQECIIGNWVLTHPNDSFPISLRPDALQQTLQYMQLMQQTDDMLGGPLQSEPYVYSYWHYFAVSQQKFKTQKQNQP
ncbi:MAG: hypothetical protein J5682_00590 [Prevotella sp.]|nr:hypothetical protein [Prevotella sp.]